MSFFTTQPMTQPMVQSMGVSTPPVEPIRRIADLEQSVEYLSSHIKQLETQIQTCVKNDKRTCESIFKLELGQRRLFHYTRTLEDYCLELDVTLRKKHLIITGIAEDPSENTPNEQNVDVENNLLATQNVVFKSLSAIHDTLNFDEIDCAYRIGKKGPKARPILIKFCKESVRDVISKKRFHLKYSDETKSTYINDDLPEKVNQQRADMRSVVDHAKSNGVPAKNMGNKIQVGNQTYTHKDLNLLPDGLKLANAKTKQTPKGIAFQGEHSVFSNFYPTQVRFNGKVFPSSEHAYQVDRAEYLGKHDLAKDILFAPTAKLAKKAAGRLGHSKDWDNVKLDRMSQIVSAKFRQNVHLRNELLKTSPAHMIEATHDTFWGCGYT